PLGLSCHLDAPHFAEVRGGAAPHVLVYADVYTPSTLGPLRGRKVDVLFVQRPGELRSALRAAVSPRGRPSEGGALGFVPGVLIGAPAYRPCDLGRFVETLDVVFGEAERAVARVLGDTV